MNGTEPDTGKNPLKGMSKKENGEIWRWGWQKAYEMCVCVWGGGVLEGISEWVSQRSR